MGGRGDNLWKRKKKRCLAEKIFCSENALHRLCKVMNSFLLVCGVHEEGAISMTSFLP
jgi:hypothetical protein